MSARRETNTYLQTCYAFLKAPIPPGMRVLILGHEEHAELSFGCRSGFFISRSDIEGNTLRSSYFHLDWGVGTFRSPIEASRALVALPRKGI